MKLRAALLALFIAIAVFVGESQATVTAVGLTLSESSSSAAVSGSTLYYAPSSSGSFTVTATASSSSSITSVDFPLITGMTGGGSVASPGPYQDSYDWTSSTVTSGLQTVTANDVDPSTMTGIVIFLNTGAGGFGGGFQAFGGAEVTYHAVGHPGAFGLFSSTTPFGGGLVLQFPVKAELPPPPVGRNPCLEASCVIKKLIAHLNAHKRYYNSLVWLGEDPNERVMKWSCCREQSLLSQIENTPIAVYGDFLVFPAAGSEAVTDGSVLPVSRLVTIPTPGVYSEGILGQCDTCEIQDPLRFSNWKDSPCCDENSTVPNSPTTPAGIKPSDLSGLTPAALTNLITLMTVPTEPASSLKDLVSTLLAKADGGSAEAKALLEKLIDAVKAGIPAATAKAV